MEEEKWVFKAGYYNGSMSYGVNEKVLLYSDEEVKQLKSMIYSGLIYMENMIKQSNGKNNKS